MGYNGIIMIFFSVFILCFIGYKVYQSMNDNKYRTVVKETSQNFFENTVYADKENELNSDNSYDLGINKYDKLIFKNPEKALEKAEIDFEDGFNAIQKEFDLNDIKSHDYKLISDYTTEYFPEDEYLAKQVAVVQGFLDIYENSFSAFQNMPN